MAVQPLPHNVPVVARPLLVTADADLLDDLIRIAASVDVLLDVAADVPSARPWYGSAPLVLVGVDLAPGCARAGLRRHRDVVVVGQFTGDGPPDWSIADELRAEHIAALPAAEPWLARRLALALDPARPVGPGPGRCRWTAGSTAPLMSAGRVAVAGSPRRPGRSPTLHRRWRLAPLT